MAILIEKTHVEIIGGDISQKVSIGILNQKIVPKKESNKIHIIISIRISSTMYFLSMFAI